MAGVISSPQNEHFAGNNRRHNFLNTDAIPMLTEQRGNIAHLTLVKHTGNPKPPTLRRAESEGYSMDAVKQTAENRIEAAKRIGEGKAGPGRPKGSRNKTTAAIKDMVVEALDNAGGVEYLTAQAVLNPTAFMTLVGKTLPLQVAGELNHAVKVSGALAWKPQQ